MSVKFKVQCKGCTQSFLVDVEIPAETSGEISLDFKDKLVAPCPTCGRDVTLPSGKYRIEGGTAELARSRKKR